MKKQQVIIGGVYSAKISDKVVPVRIDSENRHGGWDATNLQTNRTVRIKSAQKLRGPVKKGSDEMKAIAAADQENARLAEERAKAPDGMTASERAMATSADAARSKAQPMPAPEVLASVPAYDKKDKKWDTCIREGKYEHVVLDDRFENDDDAKKAGDAWLAKYTKADEAGRRKMMGWKPAKGGKALPADEKKPKAKREPKPKKESTRGPSGLDVAAQMLKDAGKPMKCKDVVTQMIEKSLWKTEGKTPAATIYAAIIREIGEKGKQARFTKTGRGEFEFNIASEKKEA